MTVEGGSKELGETRGRGSWEGRGWKEEAFYPSGVSMHH